MKKFITLLLLCLTGMAAWATDIENVAFKNDAGMYLNAAVTNDVVSVGTSSQSFSIKAVSGETKAYQLYCNDGLTVARAASCPLLMLKPMHATSISTRCRRPALLR